MTNYMRNTLTKQYAKELVAIGDLLREGKEINVDTLHERTGWSRSRCNDALVTAHLLGHLEPQK